jgi:hypothetical protein
VSKKRTKLAKKPKKKFVSSETEWKEYTAALVKWKLAYELWQKAGKEALIKYMHVMNGLGPKGELPKQMSKTWENEWMESGIQQIDQFAKEWQNMLKASGLESLFKINKEWDKFWKSPGFDPSKTYAEAMQQYTEKWQNLWKK